MSNSAMSEMQVSGGESDGGDEREFLSFNEMFWCFPNIFPFLHDDFVNFVYFYCNNAFLFFIFARGAALCFDLQFSMRTRTPSVNGSIYSPFSSTRKVGSSFPFVLVQFNLNGI